MDEVLMPLRALQSHEKSINETGCVNGVVMLDQQYIQGMHLK